jgi:mannose-6-phosphate isomerase-like protein (cupin superfamily)
MRVERADHATVKGWYLGPWNSGLPISLGYAPQGIDEPHVHTRITEIYLVARGTSELRVGDQTVTLTAGDVVVVEPGEPHTFLSSSADYFHFVIHIPGLQGDAARDERIAITRAELGL